MNFVDLGLIAPILKALEEEGYSTPTPIQQQAIPLVLQERDLLGCAQTGTGKTAAFALPILQNLAGRPSANPKKRPIRTLILTPTRELAIQIDESFGAYGRQMGLRHTVLFGGVGQKPQTDALQRGVDLLTATPGSQRLLTEGGATLDERLTVGFRTATGRRPGAKELAILKEMWVEQKALFEKTPQDVEKLLKVGESKTNEKLNRIELATATTLGLILLNHDEAVKLR